MKWKNLFKPVGNLTGDEAKSYMANHEEGSYTLLDVRQPREYEESRIPGATLIPLPQLSDRLQELDPEKPTLVYCAIGGRSRAAAQLLSGQGWNEVYNLKGGIKAYNGVTAKGPVDFGAEMSSIQDLSVSEVAGYAMGMEKGLAAFYLKAAETSDHGRVEELFRKLAGFEEKHQQRLLGLYERLVPEGKPVGKPGPVMEGGFDADVFLENNRDSMTSVEDVLSLAMMLETQALDLYLRFSGYTGDETAKALLTGIADDEKKHLKALGEMVEKGFE